ncbi:MAG TPA: thioredoxin family protein [Arachidicoccus sp.]
MKKYFFTLIACSLLGLVSKAQTTPQTADEILSSAISQAKQQHKKVLIMFHASWCGWCKKMDASIEDKSCKKYFDDNFVIGHIDIQENGTKVSLENPGGQQMYEKYGGANGIPFWLILDEQGQLLTNSNLSPTKENIGCPAQEDKVNTFVGLLKKYTPISNADAQAVHDRFVKNKG